MARKSIEILYELEQNNYDIGNIRSINISINDANQKQFLPDRDFTVVNGITVITEGNQNLINLQNELNPPAGVGAALGGGSGVENKEVSETAVAPAPTLTTPIDTTGGSRRRKRRQKRRRGGASSKTARVRDFIII